MRIVGEVVVSAVFEDEQSAILQQMHFGHEYEVWNVRKVFERVRRIGKDDVIRTCSALYELEHIGMQRLPVLVAQALVYFPYEPVMVVIFLHRHYLATTTRQQFERYAACPREQVERSGCGIEIDIHIL